MSYLLQRGVASSPVCAASGCQRRSPGVAIPTSPAKPCEAVSSAGRGAHGPASSVKSPLPSPTKTCQVSTVRLAPAAALQSITNGGAIGVSDVSALKVRCKIVVPYHKTSHGQELVLVGSCEQLGNWDVNKGLRLTWSEGHSHALEVELPIHVPISCKLVVLSSDGGTNWEQGEDRELTLAPTSLATRAAGYTLVIHWGFPTATQQVPNSLRRSGSRSSSSSKSIDGHANGHAKSNGHSSGSSMLLNGVKKALAWGADLQDRAIIPGMSSWEELPSPDAADEGAPLVQCQVTVLVPENGPALTPEQSLVLVGSGPALGSWDPAAGLPLERCGDEGSPMWTAFAELPLADSLLAKVVVVDSTSGKPLVWEPCENRSLTKLRGPDPAMITAYWGLAPTHSLEVDRLSSAAVSSNPQVVQLLRQQLAAASTQLDGLRKERDEARKVVETSRPEDAASKVPPAARFEMVQLAEQLQTARKLYEVTKKEASELGGAVGVTRQLCDAAKRELTGLARQLEAAKRAYDALAPEVERMEKRLASTNRAFDATKPELQALETQLERARGLFDRTLQKIEAAKTLVASGEFDSASLRRRGAVSATARVR